MLKSHRGEILLISAAVLFAANGIISKVALSSVNQGLSAWQMTQIRATGAFLILLTYFLIFKRDQIRVTRQEVPQLIAFGVIGIAIVQSFYFFAIGRMNVSTALIIEFTAPIWILIYLKFIAKREVSSSMWISLALCFGGLLLIAQIWKGFTLDKWGVAAAFADAFALAFYFLMGEKLGKKLSSGVIILWGLGVASVVWALLFPWWNFPFAYLNSKSDLLGRFSGQQISGYWLILFIVVVGTILPYLFCIGGLMLLSASTTSVIGMLEPIFAGIFAWWWLSEGFNAIQLIGCVTVFIGIYLADKARYAVGATK